MNRQERIAEIEEIFKSEKDINQLNKNKQK